MHTYNLQLFALDAKTISRADAAALIPEEVSREIIQGAVEQSTAMRLGRRLPDMARGQMRLPVLENLPMAYFVAGDTGGKKTTNAKWASKLINAEEVAVIVPVAENVLDDADYDIWAEVKPRLVEAFGRVIDEAIIFGSNKPSTWPNGIVQQATSAGNTVTAGANLYDDIMGEAGIISKVEEDGYFVSGHAADISMRGKLRGLKDKNDRPLFLRSMTDSGVWDLDGSPITFPRNGSWNKEDALMVSGDWSQMVYAIRKDITFKVFDSGVIQNTDGTIAYNLLQNDMVALRAVMRLGWELPNPVNSVQPTGSTRCPFAVLKAGA